MAGSHTSGGSRRSGERIGTAPNNTARGVGLGSSRGIGDTRRADQGLTIRQAPGQPAGWWRRGARDGPAGSDPTERFQPAVTPCSNRSTIRLPTSSSPRSRKLRPQSASGARAERNARGVIAQEDVVYAQQPMPH
jgi:hypothetical protein